ncbi:alpha-amylase family glycosyl hydrolase [Candidatus Flexifilum breve]|uniref:alpha-amylase family glycosyl hydrolase n=1 Tax=Candidatus Flexifilum breve TaxID=3140694 RepID=UPI0031CC9BA0
MGNDRRKIELMHSLLFTMPGAPVMYYGDEIGMGDNINLPDRNGVRTPMQWEDAPHAGFSNTQSDALYADVIRDPIYGFQNVNVVAQQADQTSLLHTVRHMILKRKALPFLAKGRLTWLEDTPLSSLSYWRNTPDGRLLALHNLADEPLTINLPEWDTLENVLQPDVAVTSEFTLPPYGYGWLRPKA